MDKILIQLISALHKLNDLLLSIAHGEAGMKPLKSDVLYNTAKASLGQHLTLNPSVPFELGCAESVSKILMLCKVFTGVPASGWQGTVELYQWLAESSQFQEVSAYESGCIIVSPSKYDPYGNISVHGHCGVTGNYCIMSNDSENGIWSEKFTDITWGHHYGDILKLKTYYYRPM